MRKIAFVLLLILSATIEGCEPSKKVFQNEYHCDNIHTQRIGAICKDGTKSNATGSGACSGHGGVKYWICK